MRLAVALAATALAASCGPPREAAETGSAPEAVARVEAADEPLGLTQNGLGPVTAGSALALEALAKVLPGYVYEEAEAKAAGVTAYRAGKPAFALWPPENGEGVGQIAVYDPAITGPGGAHPGQAYAEGHGRPMGAGCTREAGPLGVTLACPAAGAAAIVHLYELPGFDGAAGAMPRDELLQSGAKLAAMVWTRPGAYSDGPGPARRPPPTRAPIALRLGSDGLGPIGSAAAFGLSALEAAAPGYSYRLMPAAEAGERPRIQASRGGVVVFEAAPSLGTGAHVAAVTVLGADVRGPRDLRVGDPFRGSSLTRADCRDGEAGRLHCVVASAPEVTLVFAPPDGVALAADAAPSDADGALVLRAMTWSASPAG